MTRQTTRLGFASLLAAVAAVAIAGGPYRAMAGGYSEYRPDRHAERREARWRANPRAAMPEMIKALCRRSGSDLVAQDMIENLAGAAVAPLLWALADDKDCRTGAAEKTLAKILCTAQAGQESPQVTRAFAPIAAALASTQWNRIEAALNLFGWIGQHPPDDPAAESRAGRGVDWECREPGPLLDAAVAPLGRLLRQTSGRQRAQVVATLALFGQHAIPLAAQLTALLTDDEAQFEAAAALGGMGLAAAPAAAALGRLLAQTENEWRQFGVAYALGQIGAPAAVALPQLRARLDAAAANPCASSAAFPWFMRIAIRIGPAPGETVEAWRADVVAKIRKVLESLRRCDSAPAEMKLVDLLAALPAELAAAPLVAIMMDEGRSVGRRIHAAKAVYPFRSSLTDDQAATRQVLLDRDARGQTSAYPMGQGEQLRSHSSVIPRSLGNALDRCEIESGRPRSKSKTIQSTNLDLDEKMDDCLRERLCGPGSARYLRAMMTCCRYAYGQAGPEWCPR